MTRHNKGLARTNWCNISLTAEETRMLMELYEKSNCRSKCQYARDVLLRKPLVILTRNQSFDDFLAVATAIKDTLEEIGFKLQDVTRVIPGMPSDQDRKVFIDTLTGMQLALSKQMEKVTDIMFKIHELCMELRRPR
jgi:hypothetical protein